MTEQHWVASIFKRCTFLLGCSRLNKLPCHYSPLVCRWDLQQFACVTIKCPYGPIQQDNTTFQCVSIGYHSSNTAYSVHSQGVLIFTGTQNFNYPNNTLNDSLITLDKSISTVEFPFTVSNPLQCPAWCSQVTMTFRDKIQWNLKSNRHFENIEPNNAPSVNESQQQLIKRRCPLISSSSLSAALILWRWETQQCPNSVPGLR